MKDTVKAGIACTVTIVSAVVFIATLYLPVLALTGVAIMITGYYIDRVEWR
jgi:hypothetical protein